MVEHDLSCVRWRDGRGRPPLHRQFPQKLAAFTGSVRCPNCFHWRRRSPLEIALLAPEKIELISALDRLQETLAQKQEEIFAQLKSIDSAWGQDKAGSVDALLDIYQSLSYVGKWLGQTQEDLMRLNE